MLPLQEERNRSGISRFVVRRLIAEGARLRVSDPVAIERVRSVLKGVEFVEDPYEVAHGADALLLLTEWREYRELDWKRIHREMGRPLILDGRNMLAPAKMKELGFEYHSFGRPDLSANPVLVSS